MFKKILIANRGEIALRVIRACKELGIQTVAIHSTIDEDSLHVKLADESVCIGPAKAQDSYLSISKILSACEVTGADAIHPGYGFLAENAEFANVCRKCNVTFIGPSPEEIELMGDKIKAKAMMKQAGLPMLESVEISDPENIDMAPIRKMGFPVMIKAANGGGGKGIKVVHHENDFEATLQTAQLEAMAAFNDSTVFVEKFLQKARHVEFQIASDGNQVICLGERDCSIQRRYQKIIEEAPCPVLSKSKREEMINVVCDAIKKVGYHNLGTVEFLMDEKENFYFLEMNTRIQVEHPVTEAITGLDLVKLQIELAANKKLTFCQEDLSFTGHAIELRITAEDSKRLLPSCGQITSFHTPGGPGVRVDNGIYDGFVVSPYYDSLLCKLIVHGKDRKEAMCRAKAALEEFLIEGIETNIVLHKMIFSEQKFIDSDIDIKYLDNLLKLKS